MTTTNMYPLNLTYKWMLLLISLHYVKALLSMYRPSSLLSVNRKFSTAININTNDIHVECLSIDIRNECENFRKLNNCTVITGYLLISLLPRPDNVTCEFEKYQFPLLREVTDFVIFYDVRHLTSIRDMFPNLTVIRGQRLFLNYALSLTNMRDLNVLEFRSLIAIQRGHVLIGRNPKLCNLEKINWNRLTLSQGENHIFPENSNKCSTRSECRGCETPYCWSNRVCQKFENNNILNLLQDIGHCHSLCLGGCLDTTPQTCAVCKSWYDHGTCVEKCSENTYASTDYLRCYTREECTKFKKLYIYKNFCVRFCPEGYKLNKTTSECELCSITESCIKICNPLKMDEPFWIFSLADIDLLKGCQILNGSVFILIRNRIREADIIEGFSKVVEIIGHLKVYKSPYLTNLNFLKNLRKIHGQPMENEHYSLIVYNNQRLETLWPLQKNFELLRGGIYIHSNDKLCNRLIKDFVNKVIHDTTKDSIQTSDQEVLCAPTKLHLNVQVLSHCAVKLSWPQQQTANEVEIIYRALPNTKATFDVDTELDTAVCDRIKWRRILKFPKELSRNSTHYFYIISNLKSFTKYSCLVKTFGGYDDDISNYETRSELLYFITQMNIPEPPKVYTKHITENSITLALTYDNVEKNRLVNYYTLQLYDIQEKQDLIDQRDYCKEPLKVYAEMIRYEEDYDDCCARQQEENDDKWFQQQMTDTYSCSRDRLEYCHENRNDGNVIFVERYNDLNETTYKLKSLERFRLYVIQVKACNRYGCSSKAMLAERTQFSNIADNLYDLFGCRIINNHDNSIVQNNDIEYVIQFNEPQYPNSLITSYVIHLRQVDFLTNQDYRDSDNYIHCLTRLQHERNAYIFKVNLTKIYHQMAIRVNSLAGHVFTDWINITDCTDLSLYNKKSSIYNKKFAFVSSKGWNIFIICFLLGASISLLWISYKYRYWNYIIECRHLSMPINYREWFYTLIRRHNATVLSEDLHVLVDTVQYHNNGLEDEVIYLRN